MKYEILDWLVKRVYENQGLSFSYSRYFELKRLEDHFYQQLTRYEV